MKKKLVVELFTNELTKTTKQIMALLLVFIRLSIKHTILKQLRIRMRYLVVILLSSAFSFLYSQTLNIDSLKSEIPKMNVGEEKVDLYNQLSDSYRKMSDIDSGIEYGIQALELSKKINYLSGEILALNFLGLNLRDRSEFAESKEYFKKAKLLLENSKDSIQIAYTYNNIGTIDRMIGNYGPAIENILYSKNIFQEVKHLPGLVNVYINLGLLYSSQNQYSKAIENFEIAKNLCEELNDSAGFLYAIYQLGRSNFRSGNFRKALSYYKIGKDYLDQCSDCPKRNLGDMLTGLGEVYDHLADFTLSLNYFQLAIQIFEQEGDRTNLAVLYNSIGNVYIEIRDYPKAKYYFDKSYELSEIIELDERILDVLLSYSKLYKAQGQYRTAVQYFEAYNSLRDTLFSSQKINEISNIETKYAVLEQERENEILKERIEYQESVENYLIIIVVLSIMIIFFIYSFTKNILASNRKLQTLNKTKDLFFSIIAHDVKNPFGAILNYSEFLKEDYENMSMAEIADFADSIHTSSREVYQLLENLLYWARSQKGEILLERKSLNLCETTEDVFRLLKNNAESKEINFENTISSDTFVYADENILKTVLRNLISNAIKFTEPGGDVTVSASNGNGIIKMSVADSGVGMDEDELKELFDIGTSNNKVGTQGEKGSGLGLILSKEFIEKNGGEITVNSSKGKGSTFSFTLPATTAS